MSPDKNIKRNSSDKGKEKQVLLLKRQLQKQRESTLTVRPTEMEQTAFLRLPIV